MGGGGGEVVGGCIWGLPTAKRKSLLVFESFHLIVEKLMQIM